jgi:RNA polymerase II subunit A C-terminal domain phosphatase
MRLQTPPNLQYPITIHSLLKQPKDRVARLDGLFTYHFMGKNQVQDDMGKDVEEEFKFFGTFDSSVDGVLGEWRVREGQVIKGPG